MSVEKIDLTMLPSASDRLLRSAWWTPLIDADRQASWIRYREQIHSAIVRIRREEGFDTPSALGDHWYATTRMRRPDHA